DPLGPAVRPDENAKGPPNGRPLSISWGPGTLLGHRLFHFLGSVVHGLGSVVHGLGSVVDGLTGSVDGGVGAVLDLIDHLLAGVLGLLRLGLHFLLRTAASS